GAEGGVGRCEARPLPQHETTIDHDTIDGGAIFRQYQLPQRIAQRYVVDVPDIEEDDVRSVSRFQAADAIEAKDCSATFGRRSEYLLDRQPSIRIDISNA